MPGPNKSNPQRRTSKPKPQEPTVITFAIAGNSTPRDGRMYRAVEITAKRGDLGYVGDTEIANLNDLIPVITHINRVFFDIEAQEEAAKAAAKPANPSGKARAKTPLDAAPDMANEAEATEPDEEAVADTISTDAPSDDEYAEGGDGEETAPEAAHSDDYYAEMAEHLDEEYTIDVYSPEDLSDEGEDEAQDEFFASQPSPAVSRIPPKQLPDHRNHQQPVTDGKQMSLFK